MSFFESLKFGRALARISESVTGPLGYPFWKFLVEPIRRKVFPGLLVCQIPEVVWRTAPDRDSGSERQRIRRGESVLVSE